MNEKFKEKWNSFWKKTGMFFGSIFTVLSAILLGRSISERRAAKHTRDDIDRANDTNREAGSTAEDIEHTATEIKRRNDECQNIIKDIRERNKKK